MEPFVPPSSYLTHDQIEECLNKLTRYFDADPDDPTVNLKFLQRVDSSVMCLFLMIARYARARNKKVTVLNIPEKNPFADEVISD